MDQIHTISITGRRWFQRSYGNTYFSAVAHVNGKEAARIDYEYGYGDQYLQRIAEELIQSGAIPPNTERKALTWYLRDLCQAPGGFTYSVVDVDRKKDL